MDGTHTQGKRFIGRHITSWVGINTGPGNWHWFLESCVARLLFLKQALTYTASNNTLYKKRSGYHASLCCIYVKHTTFQLADMFIPDEVKEKSNNIHKLFLNTTFGLHL